jgi:cyclic pyranopterin monophosphate synthase
MGKLKKLTHVDARGRARMVNVGAKPDQFRRAVARGFVRCSRATIRLLKKQALPKGDVLTVAQIAGIQAAKQTSHLIPLCHALPLTGVEVSFRITATGVGLEAAVECRGKTGVELEALTAVSVAALAIYDMCKAVDSALVIEKIHLVSKVKR